MKKTILFLASLSLVSLGGCHHHHVSGKLRLPGVSVGVNTKSGGGGGGAPARGHCPPGQAKKGNC